MEDFERWENMLNSVGTSPKVWRVFEEMKQEIAGLREELKSSEKHLEGAIFTNTYGEPIPKKVFKL